MNLLSPTNCKRRPWLAWLASGILLFAGCSSSEFKATREKAMSGDPQAQLDLGLMYLAGKVTKQSDAEAVKWCLKASDQGLPAALRVYGLMLRDGAGVPRNPAQGRQWLEKAANKGDVIAQVELGSMLGLFSPPFEYVEAMKWLIIAERKGATNAPAMIKLVTEQMSPAELAQARAKADAFGK